MKPTILIAEDNLVNMLLLKSIFENILPNAEVVEAENGSIAIERFELSAPDIVFMDIRMPEISGYDAAIAIRKIELGTRVPIIALTAGTAKGEREKCLAAGMDDYISKPVVQDSILKVMYQWLPLAFTEHVPMGSTVSVHLEGKHFDRDELMNRLADNEQMLEKLLTVSRTSLDSCLKDLNEQVRGRLFHEVRETAHKLKGLAMSSCFNELILLAKQLEEQTDYEEATVEELVDKIRNEIEYVVKLISVS